MVPQRIRLNWKQKHAIFRECRRRGIYGGRSKVSQISEWACQALKLKKKPSYRAVLDIIKNAEKIEMKAQSTHYHMKKDLSVSNQEVENLVVEFVWKMSRHQVCISDDIIIEKAKRIQQETNNRVQESQRTNLRFSNGWLAKFKKRNGFKMYRSHGENGDADRAAIRTDLPILQTLLSAFSPSNTFNADEFGLFYRLAPNTTIGPKRLPGRKKKKERLTFLACVNADGSERVAPLVIGKSKNPRCFNRRTGEFYGIHYRGNKKAWMNRLLFYEWLYYLDSYIARFPGRRVVLLIDNASAHGEVDILPNLHHVLVLFLPANTTSMLQPIDAGIIASVKKRFRRHQIENAVDLIEAGVTENLYDMDVLTASKVIYSIWGRLPSSIIHNCWLKTGLLDVSDDVGEGDETLGSS